MFRVDNSVARQMDELGQAADTAERVALSHFQPAIPPVLNHDDEHSARSLRVAAQRFADDGATLWAPYDHDQYASLRRSPEHYS